MDDLSSHGLCGTPDEVVRKLGAWAEAGIQRLYLQFLALDDLDHLELLGQAVLPGAGELD